MLEIQHHGYGQVQKDSGFKKNQAWKEEKNQQNITPRVVLPFY